jgi:hypothetical protein
MFGEIIFALDPIFHKPLILYGGLFTGLVFMATSTAGYLVHKGNLDFKWHLRLVITLILLVLVHATAAILAYF